MNVSIRARARRGPSLPTGADAGAARDPLHYVPLYSAILLSAALAACVETGDFGRPRPTVWNDAVLPAAGAQAARARGEPVSDLPLTDFERELRDRAWRFLMPAHERAHFEAQLANLARHRVLPASARAPESRAYLSALMEEPFASPVSRFRRIGEDATADARLIAPFAVAAAAVLAADDARLASLASAGGLTGAEVAQATARVGENRCLVAWVALRLGERESAYRYALQRAFLAMPDGSAAQAERGIAALAAHRAILHGLPPSRWRGGPCAIPALEAPVAVPLSAKG